MSSSSQKAASFVNRLAELAGRLAEKDIVVSRLVCDWGSFGRWEVQAQRGSEADRYSAALSARQYTAPGPEVVRFMWDGRERQLLGDASPTRPLSAPNQWKSEVDKTFAEGGEDPLHFLETYLIKRLS